MTVTNQDFVEATEKMGDAFIKFKEKYNQKYIDCDKRMDDFETMLQRQGLNPGSGGTDNKLAESRKGLAAYLRGAGNIQGAMTVGDDPGGGYTVIPFLQTGISQILRNRSVLRQLVDVSPMGANDAYEEILSLDAAGATWVQEGSARTETTTPDLKVVRITLDEIYAMPVVSQRLVDDSREDIAGWLTQQVGTSFSEAENLAFISGDGIDAPRGIGTYTTATADDATRTWTEIQYTPSGAAGAFAGTDPGDAIIEMFYKLKSGYRSNSTWLMNSDTARQVMQLKDGNGNYLWNHGDIATDRPASLLGRPVIVHEDVPNIAADSLSIWLGDWSQAVRFIERQGNKILLDPYTNKPNLNVYVYRCVGFGVRDFNALKVMKFAAS